MKLNIIIADDEYFIRKKLIKILSDNFDFIERIYEAENGEILWQLTREIKPEIIISDIRMPGMEGLDVLKLINENKISTKLIIISGYNEFEYAKTAVKYSAFDYILKPITEDELISSLNRTYLTIVDEQKSNYKFKLNLLLDNIHNETDTETFLSTLDISIFNPYIIQLYRKNIIEETKSILFFFKRSGCEYFLIKEDNDTYTIFMYSHNEYEDIISKFIDFLNTLYLDSYYFLAYSRIYTNISIKRTYQELCNKIKLRNYFPTSKAVQINSTQDYHGIISSQIKDMTEKNFSNINFSVEYIAKNLGLNSSYIGSIFKKENDISIIKYINAVRLNKAKNMLKNTDKKLSDIALSCGFNDVYYFSKKYKHFFGYSPGNERRNN